jgi:hypothetical protein
MSLGQYACAKIHTFSFSADDIRVVLCVGCKGQHQLHSGEQVSPE